MKSVVDPEGVFTRKVVLFSGPPSGTVEKLMKSEKRKKPNCFLHRIEERFLENIYIKVVFV